MRVAPRIPGTRDQRLQTGAAVREFNNDLRAAGLPAMSDEQLRTFLAERPLPYREATD